MAAPNLISATSIIGRTTAEWITTTPTAILTNAASSNQVHRVNVLYTTNLGSSDATVTVDIYRSNVSYKLAAGVPVPVGAPLVILGKDTSIYLEEGDALRISSNTAGVLQFVLSYEVMS